MQVEMGKLFWFIEKENNYNNVKVTFLGFGFLAVVLTQQEVFDIVNYLKV